MQFCPKCGGLMMPVRREEGRVILRCMRCGHEVAIDATTAVKHFRIETRIPAEERVITTSRVSTGGRRRAKELEEWEQEREEYREVLLEYLQQELEGSEE